MGKKRKTRQEKIILQLKRQLSQQKPVSSSLGTKSPPSQEAILKEPQTQPQNEAKLKNTDIPILSYNLRLIKKDLLKSLILTMIIVSLEIVLYLRLR